MLSEELKYPSNFTPEVQNATAELYKGVEKVIPAVEWPFHSWNYFFHPFIKFSCRILNFRSKI